MTYKYHQVHDIYIYVYIDNTALHLAAMSPKERVEKTLHVLLESGADPNRLNWFGIVYMDLFIYISIPWDISIMQHSRLFAAARVLCPPHRACIRRLRLCNI
jgi:hypothetical protein